MWVKKPFFLRELIPRSLYSMSTYCNGYQHHATTSSKRSTHRKKVIQRVRKLVALAQVSLPRPSIPLGHLLLHNAHVPRQLELAQQLQDGPERLHLGQQRRLHRMDLSEDLERALAARRVRQWHHALVQPPAPVRLPRVGVRVFSI